MRHRTLRTLLTAALAATLTLGVSSCGTMRTHWGVEHEYNYDFDEGHPYHGKHKPPKPPKPPKKHKKHKKHKHHHHHDDDCRR